MTDFGRRTAAGAHAASHQDEGTDEIQVDGLHGELADNQPTTWTKVSGTPSTYPPDPHGDEHEAGEDMEIDVGGLRGVLADSQKAAWAAITGKPDWLDGKPQSDDFSATREPLFWKHYTDLTVNKSNWWDRGVNLGYLTMYAGKNTDWSGSSYAANFPYQVVTDGFQVDTKIVLDASPGKQWKGAGIILVWDRYNSIKLTRTYDSSEIIQLLYVVNDSNYVTQVAFSANTFWLRVLRIGPLFACWHSINGTDWILIADPGTVFTTAAPMWVGPIVQTGGAQAESFIAKFDFFNF